MNKNPLDFIKENDNELFTHISANRNSAIKEGELSVKTKLLIGLALDAAKGTADGVKSFAKQAGAAGASKEEILEALRIVYYICGVGSIYTAAKALEDIF